MATQPQVKEYHIPGEMLEAFKTRPVPEWERMFEALLTKKLSQIPGCTTTDQLLQVQAQAKYSQELLQFFLEEMRR